MKVRQCVSCGRMRPTYDNSGLCRGCTSSQKMWLEKTVKHFWDRAENAAVGGMREFIDKRIPSSTEQYHEDFLKKGMQELRKVKKDEGPAD